MSSFNLVDAPWIPVQAGGGQTALSLRDALVNAHGIDDLAPPRPTMVPALLRQVLLPVAIDALGVPRSEDDWSERWSTGRLDPAAINDYLDRHHDRFDLFHPTQPFAQVGGLESTTGQTKPSSLLVPSIASGNNVPLFSARLESEPPDLSPAEAALWLVHAHCWDTAAIKTGAAGDPRVKRGKTTGNPTGPLGQFEVVAPIGRNLFDTLLLNTRILADGLPADDRPQWRVKPADATWQERPPCGLLDLFTWQSRRIRLFPSEATDGTVVREVLVCAGDRLIVNHDLEPHASWRHNRRPRANQPPRSPRRPRPGRHVWQGLDAQLALHPPEDGEVEASRLLQQAGNVLETIGDDYPLRVLTVGLLYGNQSAVVDHAVADLMPLPVAALREHQPVWELLVGVVMQTEDVSKALNGLHADLRRARSGEPIPWDRGQRPTTELTQLLDPAVRRLLAGLQQEPDREDEAAWAWQETAHREVWRLAERMLDAVPPAAFAGREDPRGNYVYRPANAEATFRMRVAKALPDRDALSATFKETKPHG